MTFTEKITVVLSHVNHRYMEAYSVMLESGNYSVVGRISDETKLVECLSVKKPDILLYDLYISSDFFQNSFKKFSEASTKTKIIVLSENYQELARLCINCGASGFFDEDLVDEHLVQNYIYRINNGEKLVLTNQALLQKAK